MMRDCAINIDHIQTVSIGNKESLITALSAEKLAHVSGPTAFALDLWLRASRYYGAMKAPLTTNGDWQQHMTEDDRFHPAI